MTLTTLLIPTFRHQLTALRAWLDKGEAHAAAQGMSEAELLGVRLAVDMFPLHSQVRIAAFLVQETVHRLRGEDTPAATVDLRTHAAIRQEETGSLADLRAIIDSALASLDDLGDAALDAAADRPLAHALPMGMVFDMTGFTFARDWALPQVSFHTDMAYALLRSAGVPLGKPDYVPHMFAYLRPGTMAGA
ncbi:DUF1993 family protein [Sphingomonas astaxanthinifaciens]|uniref:DUF1993 domain-containing protein n=1 Tax=Sphingomonas astaxanthinifaciens DSM 22298 TaxID=1123267 RepID=A0ABQ5Z4W6_9SPHN|nr:DUF1993 domain-containing protein [Sphingomonas astaxanthinifaciens]GLR46527.1 hypothetical protein GCM10007925_02380 [Sphingomonas astaxanthinifaciens DSM 22298]